ncbi:hypothetical protein I3760_13G087200 [Carya illinoinensis]|nr:hypothetical protein I3760_13G087200 [Carya illinoinensis]
MESDHPTGSTPENLDQAATSDIHDQGASQGRSYDCTFCKRGFSNAQALGGHMNIHRKEKAKLKRLVNESQPSSNIPRVTPSYSPIPRNSSWPLEAKPGDGRSPTKWPWLNPSQQYGDHFRTRYETRVGDVVQQLPLFVETPMSDKDQRSCSQFDHGKTDVGLSSPSTRRESSGSEIDLELRLGAPEPDHDQDPYSTATGTKKFF